MRLYAKYDAHAMPRKENNKNPLSLGSRQNSASLLKTKKKVLKKEKKNGKQADPTYKAVSN